MAVLNITNGDGAANVIKASSVAGDVLPWRDPMHHGPFPAGLDLPELSKVRADYLSGPGIDRDETRRGFRLRDDHLNGASRYDEVVLWFEHDLLDQLQILQLFDWFYETAFDRSKLTLICIRSFRRSSRIPRARRINARSSRDVMERASSNNSRSIAIGTHGLAGISVT